MRLKGVVSLGKRRLFSKEAVREFIYFVAKNNNYSLSFEFVYWLKQFPFIIPFNKLRINID